MLRNRLIVCLDVKNGRTVKGVNFEGLIDAGDPVAQAQFYSRAGADELCFLDINASHENRAIIYDLVSKVAKSCFIPFVVGGGVRDISDIRQLLLCGADKVAINSAAIKNPQLISDAAQKFGSQSIIVALDVKKNQKNNDYEIYINGGRIATGINALDLAKKMQELGAGEILLTSMDRDGTRLGYDLDLIKMISDNLKIPLIASGGVGNLDHLVQGIKAGASAVLAASIFHFGDYSIKEAKEFMVDHNIAMRISASLKYSTSLIY